MDNPSAQDMTMRDVFAAAALQGLLAEETSRNAYPQWYAREAYEIADAMLAERCDEEGDI